MGITLLQFTAAILALVCVGWAHKCPQECSCQGAIEAKCTSDTLEELPQGFDPDLLVLVGQFPRLATLRNDTFARMGTPELATVHLRYGDVHTVEPGAFLALPKLSDVDLSDNRLAGLPPAAFPDSVRRVSVEGNPLRLPESGTFLDSAQLGSLHLSRCGITALPDRVFQGTPRITYLMLSDNLLEEANPEAFRNLASLEILNLNNNRLRTLHPDTFQHNRKLVILGVSGNHLVFTQNTPFLNSPFIQHIYLGSNQLTTLSAYSLRNMTALETISLDDNLLESIDGAFDFNPMLRMVFVSKNRIRSIDPNAFRNNLALYEVSLSDNALTLPDNGSLLNTHGLGTLNLANCGITKLPHKVFQEMTGLKNIFLNNNRMSRVDTRALEGLQQLMWASFSENPAVCPCVLRELADWAASRNVMIAANCQGRESKTCP